MSRTRLSTVLCFSLFAFACGGGGSGADDDASPEDARGAIAEAESQLDKIFDKELRKKACEILTPTMVADILGVPEDELEQRKIMGCQYSWSNDTETGWASLMLITAHKDVATAKIRFTNSTKGMSRKDVAKVMGDVQEKLKEDGELDTEPKKQAAGLVGGALMAGAGKDGFQFERLDGIGDEAAVGLSDGNVKVRVGNLVFTVTGYKGPEKPATKAKLDPKNMDLKAYTAKIMEEEREWVKATLEDRKAYGKLVAEAVMTKF
jgi:hypothetical protein